MHNLCALNKKIKLQKPCAGKLKVPQKKFLMVLSQMIFNKTQSLKNQKKDWLASKYFSIIG